MRAFDRTVVFICYLLGIVPSGVVLLLERRSDELRFHAAQALLFHLALLIVFVPISLIGTWVVMDISKPVGIGIMSVAIAYELVMAVAWGHLLIGAARGGRRRLPWLTGFAERAVRRSS